MKRINDRIFYAHETCSVKFSYSVLSSLSHGILVYFFISTYPDWFNDKLYEKLITLWFENISDKENIVAYVMYEG